MILLAALALASWAVSTLAFLRVLDHERRAHARERDLLVNQVCNLAGKAWLPAPADVDDTPSWVPDEEPHEWLEDPEQAVV